MGGRTQDRYRLAMDTIAVEPIICADNNLAFALAMLDRHGLDVMGVFTQFGQAVISRRDIECAVTCGEDPQTAAVADHMNWWPSGLRP